VAIRAVLFDATGVLIELAEPVGATYAEAARRFGVRLPAWRLEDAFRRVLRHAPPRVFPGRTPEAAAGCERAWWREIVRQTFQAADSTVRFADFEALFADLYTRYQTGTAWRARPGAHETIRTLRANGRATGVVSNFDHRLTPILEALGISELLDVVVIPSQCGFAKPDPAIFRTALAALDTRPDEAVYVGHDPDTDLAGATAAGLIAIRLAEDEALGTLPARIERVANLGA